MPFAKVFHAVPEAGMHDVAARIAADLTPGSLLALDGDLGAGKTTLARDIIRILTGNPGLDVPSPTFTLVQTYDTPAFPIWHFDFYRLKSPEDVYEIGWEDALSSRGVIIMEWSERLGPLLPAGATRIVLTARGQTRDIEVAA